MLTKRRGGFIGEPLLFRKFTPLAPAVGPGRFGVGVGRSRGRPTRAALQTTKGRPGASERTTRRGQTALPTPAARRQRATRYPSSPSVSRWAGRAAATP